VSVPTGRATPIVVEVGDWEHECCGPAYERDSVVDVTCLVVPEPDGSGVRYVESHHDLTTRHPVIQLRGRVSDLCIEHPDGSTDPLERLPSGRALRGFDDDDDGHLVRLWTAEPVVNDSNRFLLTLTT
jgi:hypothetical protein